MKSVNLQNKFFVWLCVTNKETISETFVETLENYFGSVFSVCTQQQVPLFAKLNRNFYK